MPTTTSRASGHGHPRVTEAIARQARRLNTNLRYLHESRDRARRAADRDLPARPRHGVLRQLGLGGERPRVAPRDDRHRAAWRAVHGLRLPRHLRGDRRALARDVAGRPRRRPTSRPGAARTPPRARTSTAARSQAAIDELVARGHAAGGGDPRRRADERRLSRPSDADLAETWLGRGATRPAALWIADEVQGGHGRTGDAMWSFGRFGIDPGHRHARQADGQRPPGRGGHHPARDRRRPSPTRPSSSARSAATPWPWPRRWRSSTSSRTSAC